MWIDVTQAHMLTGERLPLADGYWGSVSEVMEVAIVVPFG